MVLFDLTAGGAAEPVEVATVFAMVVTKVVDLLRNMFDTTPPKRPKWLWNVLALALGVAVALVWHVNMLDNFTSTAPQGVFGQLLTGLAIAGAASGWHELFDTLSGTAKNAKAGAGVKDAQAASLGSTSRPPAV
jgi:hypothetical protein